MGFAFGGGRQPHSRGWICPHPETILGRVRPIYSQWVCDKLESLTNVGRLCFSLYPSFQVQRIFWEFCQKLIIWLVCYPNSWNPRKHTDIDCIIIFFLENKEQASTDMQWKWKGRRSEPARKNIDAHLTSKFAIRFYKSEILIILLVSEWNTPANFSFLFNLYIRVYHKFTGSLGEITGWVFEGY